MRTKNILIVMAALALGWLPASCVKEKSFDSYKETTDGRFGTVEEQIEYLNGVLETIGEEQVELDAYLEKLEESSNALAPIVDSLMKDLDVRMKAVRDSLPNYAKKSKMEVTFATLAKVESLSEDLAALEVKVKSDSIALTATLNDKIAATKAKLTEEFKSYYTKTILDARIKAQNDRMDTLAMDIDSAKTDIKTLKENIAELETKHTEISGKLDAGIKELMKADTVIVDSIAALDTRIAVMFDTLVSRVKENTEAIAALEARVTKLENRVQSIEVVPDYADGSVDMAKKDSVAIRFEVRPRRLIDSLAGKDSLFSFQIIKTTAATKAGIFADTIPVQKVTTSKDEDSLLIVTVNGAEMHEDFFKETQTYSARLVLSDGNTDRTSAYFPLIPVIETANCYIVSAAGTYKLKTVKGNSKESVGAVKSAKVLWESYGTDSAPAVGEIISNVSYSDGKITYTATSAKGNAVIAAYDGDNGTGNILWSWHIWCTDQPGEQEYKNGAGFMLDRNLGAIDTAKGSVGALGLLYQWGRKDPFLGADGISSTTQAASTLTWPSAKAASECLEEGNNTLSYSIKNPMTLITNLSKPSDWYCTAVENRNDSLWNVTSSKTRYDPCPVGWRVPDGGSSGVWRTAFGKDYPALSWDDTNKGSDFGSGTDKLVSSGVCWYPAAGNYTLYGSLFSGSKAWYWSCTPSTNNAYALDFYNNSDFNLSNPASRAIGCSVRCEKE